MCLEGFPPFTAVALRFGVAAFFLVAYAGFTGAPLRPGSRLELRLWVAHALLSFCVSYGVIFWAEQWVPSGLASVLFASFALMVAVMAHFAIPGERVTGISLAGVVLGLGGIATLYAGDFAQIGGPRVATAALVLLLSPFASALGAVAVKRWGKGLNPVSLNAAGMGIGSALMALVAAFFERGRPVRPEPAPLAAILYLAVVGSAVTFCLYCWLIEHLPVGQVALIGYTVPVVAIAVGALFLDEPITVRTLLGSALVVLGVSLAAYHRKRAHIVQDL